MIDGIEIVIAEGTGQELKEFFSLADLGVHPDVWIGYDIAQKTDIARVALMYALPWGFYEIDSVVELAEENKTFSVQDPDEKTMIDLAIDWGIPAEDIEHQIITSMAAIGADLFDSSEDITITGMNPEAVFETFDEISDIEVIVRRRFPTQKKSRTIH